MQVVVRATFCFEILKDGVTERRGKLHDHLMRDDQRKTTALKLISSLCYLLNLSQSTMLNFI